MTLLSEEDETGPQTCELGVGHPASGERAARILPSGASLRSVGVRGETVRPGGDMDRYPRAGGPRDSCEEKEQGSWGWSLGFMSL